MRGKGAEELQEGEEKILGDFLGGSVGIGALHHRADSGVETKRIYRLLDTFDRLVRHLSQVIILTFNDFAAELPLSFGVLRTSDAPDFGKKAVDAFNTFHSPGFILIERAHEHFVEAERVRAVVLYHIIWIHHIAERLGHLLTVLTHNESWRKIFFKGFLGLQVTKIVENLVPEA